MARINYSNADRQEASRPHQQSRFPFHGFSRSVGSLWRSLFADGSLKRVLSNWVARVICIVRIEQRAQVQKRSKLTKLQQKYSK